MELLLAHANAELASLAPRYLLQRVKAQDLELQVVDRDMGDEVRSTSSLSGGETFLVSLALALGLSSLASEKVRIESLFIDEDFGSLDPMMLETALSTLDSLQSAGRKVGLIAYVPGLVERVGVQVLVERRRPAPGPGRPLARAGQHPGPQPAHARWRRRRRSCRRKWPHRRCRAAAPSAQTPMRCRPVPACRRPPRRCCARPAPARRPVRGRGCARGDRRWPPPPRRPRAACAPRRRHCRRRWRSPRFGRRPHRAGWRSAGQSWPASRPAAPAPTTSRST